MADGTCQPGNEHYPSGEPEASPLMPETVEELGISPSLIEQIVLKMLYFRGELIGRDLAKALGLKYSLIHEIVESLKLQHLIEVKRALGLGSPSAVLAISESGRARARIYLELNQYAGPVPVPLEQYTDWVRKQRRKPGWLKPHMLAKAYGRMVLSSRILSQIGPAISSGNSFLIYGKPGDGKSYLAESLRELDDSTVFLPFALEYQANIIQVYDPIYHERIGEPEQESVVLLEPTTDGRWLQCRRPFIMTGGELTLDMLDLSYNTVSKVYEAPLQVKANNGVYLIDDFGRQRATPAEVLNRWIVPMERKIDYLGFRTGGKITVPFEVFLLFSTNLKPEQLGDEAFLRRIQYKMLMRSPDEDEFREIFLRYCVQRELPCADGLADWFIEKYYRRTGKHFRRCHPRDVLTHAINLIQFEDRPYVLDEQILNDAFESCFVQEDFD